MTQNIIKAILPALAISLLAVGCSEDKSYPDYEPATVPGNHQVYFDYTENHTFTVDEDNPSVTVKVYRIATDGDLSVAYTATQPDGQDNVFQLPTTINFAAGQSVTDLTINIDLTTMQPRQAYTLDLAIDSSETTDYGDATCSLSVQYFTKGDPMRDAICGFYGGEAAGGQYWSNPFIYTAWSQTYGSDGVNPLRIVPGEAANEVLLENLLPDNDAVAINQIVGTVTTIDTKADAIEFWGGADYYPSSNWGSDYDLLGYITFPAQECGTITLNYYGLYTYQMYFAAAWATGSWATSPTGDLYVYIVGKRNTDGSISGKKPGDATYNVKQLDFYSNGWCMMFGYAEYGAWYYAAYGGNVVDIIE
jgi:hypothetical protein